MATVETNDDVYRFTWNVDGLGKLQTDQIPTGQVTVAGNRVFVTVPTFNREADDLSDSLGSKLQTELRIFALTTKGVESRGSLNLGVGSVVGIQVNEAANQVAIAISSDGRVARNDSISWAAKVLIFDLTGDAEPVSRRRLQSRRCLRK